MGNTSIPSIILCWNGKEKPFDENDEVCRWEEKAIAYLVLLSHGCFRLSLTITQSLVIIAQAHQDLMQFNWSADDGKIERLIATHSVKPIIFWFCLVSV